MQPEICPQRPKNPQKQMPLENNKLQRLLQGTQSQAYSRAHEGITLPSIVLVVLGVSSWATLVKKLIQNYEREVMRGDGWIQD